MRALGSIVECAFPSLISIEQVDAGTQIPTTALLDVAVTVIDVRVIETVVLTISATRKAPDSNRNRWLRRSFPPRAGLPSRPRS